MDIRRSYHKKEVWHNFKLEKVDLKVLYILFNKILEIKVPI